MKYQYVFDDLIARIDNVNTAEDYVYSQESRIEQAIEKAGKRVYKQ